MEPQVKGILVVIIIGALALQVFGPVSLRFAAGFVGLCCVVGLLMDQMGTNLENRDGGKES